MSWSAVLFGIAVMTVLVFIVPFFIALYGRYLGRALWHGMKDAEQTERNQEK